MALNKERIKNSFSKSAINYDQYAGLQRDMAAKLFEGLSGDFKGTLDIGSGTGELAFKLAVKYPKAKIVGLDLAPGMVKVATKKAHYNNVSFIEGDGEALPFDKENFDLVVSSASLQWMEPIKAFAEVARILKPQGEFHFTTFGPATLCELKNLGLSVNDFVSKGKLEEMLAQNFKLSEFTAYMVVRHYPNLFELFKYLRGLGAQNPMRVNHKGLITKGKIDALLPIKEQINASFEVFVVRTIKML